MGTGRLKLEQEDGMCMEVLRSDEHEIMKLYEDRRRGIESLEVERLDSEL